MTDQVGPSPGELRLVAMAIEDVLRVLARDGVAPTPGLARLAGLAARSAPAVAARCPYLVAAAGPEVAAAVTRAVTGEAEARALRVTGGDPHGGDPARSRPVWLRPAQAAPVLGMGVAGIRAACRRGRLTARKAPDGGWLIDAASVRAYRRQPG
jgi:hypothetical protein